MDQIFKRQIRSLSSPGQLIQIEIKDLSISLLPEIIDIAKESFEKVWNEKEFAYFISHDSGVCFGAFDNSRLIGFFMGLLSYGELDIVSVAVLKEYRRRGVAENLIECVVSLPQIEKCFLEVEAGNPSAIKLYAKMGFVEYGIRKKYYAGVKDAVLMKWKK